MTLFSVPSLGIALDGPVRPIKRKAPNIKDYGKAGGYRKNTHVAKLLRVLNKAPEVLVKISGSGKSQGHLLAHMTYISRNGKLAGENERGEKIEGTDEVNELFEQWGFDAKNSEKTRAKSVHIVLSMKKGTDPNAVLWAARKFALEKFAENHQYFMVLHTDTDHPHVHLAVKAQGFDMTWLKRSKADLQEWREIFAARLREQGIQAEATPRRARGVVQKGKTQPMHHIGRDKDKKNSPRSMGSTVIQRKVDAIIREVDGQINPPDRPWERAIRDRQVKVLDAYADIEKRLRSSGDGDSHMVADKLSLFLKDFQLMETERASLQRQLMPVIEAQKGKLRLPGPDPSVNKLPGSERSGPDRPK